MKPVNSVEGYIAKKGEWQESLTKLRSIMRSTKMEETVKWGIPTYTVGGKNVAGLAAFKSYVGIWFFQGALLKDAQNKLVNAQEGTTKAQRQWRFQSVDEIRQEAPTIRQYVEEAIANQEAGKEIKPSGKKPLNVPSELQEALEADPNLNSAFEELTLSKKREYAEHISGAKQEATRQRRLDKVIPMIRKGIGLNDKYRK